jgi:imidazolonepropionase-like amidohydrolase
LYDLQLELVKLFEEEGVQMLAGSDMTGGWCIPGFSLQQEFRELSRAGLSPLKILQMTTLKGAEFLGREAVMGTVEEGKNADLVLLDANPIESAGNLGKIHAVVLRGRCLPKAELEKMKSDVESFYARGRK